ncbi:MAG: phosphate/phosphite/phosphonate ABC transporter substrate-binding protein [Planctomycetota bacterium]|jgi:phosphonate transport system substrate-binding protein
MHPSKAFLITLFLVAESCSSEVASYQPELLRIGVLPNRSKDVLQRRYAPLVDYLGAKLEMPTTLVIPEDYEELIDLFAAGELDLAHLDGKTFLEFNASIGAVPLVMRGIDLRLQSTFLVRSDLEVSDLQDCKDLRIAFGSNQSTSGHLMPRYFLGQSGIQPETYFSEVIYAKSQDHVAELIQSGAVDLGVVSRWDVDNIYETENLDRAGVRVLTNTAPYTDTVWAAQRTLDVDLRSEIRNAFLSLSIYERSEMRILLLMGGLHYLPASQEDFAMLRNMLAQMNSEARLR